MPKLLGAIAILLFLALPLLSSAQGLVPCTNTGADQCDFADLLDGVGRVLRYLIYFVGTPLAAIMFAYAGFLYLTAGENEGKVRQAHDIFVSVLWGFGVMIVAWALVSFIINFLTDGSFSLIGNPGF